MCWCGCGGCRWVLVCWLSCLVVEGQWPLCVVVPLWLCVWLSPLGVVEFVRVPSGRALLLRTKPLPKCGASSWPFGVRSLTRGWSVCWRRRCTYVICRSPSEALPRTPLRVNRVVSPQTPHPCLGQSGPLRLNATQKRGRRLRLPSSNTAYHQCPAPGGRLDPCCHRHHAGVNPLRVPLCSSLRDVATRLLP